MSAVPSLETQVPAPRQDRPRRPPLTAAQQSAILHAVTVEGRSQRSVAADPTFGASHDQVRGVVARALDEDPSLLVKFPHLAKRPPADIVVLTLEERDDVAAMPTAAELLAGMEVDPAVLGMEVGRIRWRSSVRPRLCRDTDGTVSAVCIPQVSVEVDWVLARPEGGADRRDAAPPRHPGRPDHVTSRAPRRPWYAVALIVIGLLLVAFAAHQIHHRSRPGVASVTPTEGVHGPMFTR